MRLAPTILLAFIAASRWLAAAETGSAPQPRSYCNPLNLDYGYCPSPNFVEQGKHRATADPALATFRGD